MGFCFILLSALIRRPHSAVLIALLWLGMSPAAEEQRLTVYSPQTSFAVQVTDHDGHEYVSLTDLLDPFGRATLYREGKRWRLKFSNRTKLEGEFAESSTRAKLKGKKIVLSHPFWAANSRGYIPIGSAAIILSQILHMDAHLGEDSRRLFLGGVVTTYSAELQKNNPSKLVLHFSAPVNPRIATEPGQVRMTFSREPIVSGVANPQSFDDPTIRSATFHEANGTAEITISTAAPVLATFSDNGKTITLAPLRPQVAQVAPVEGTTAATSTPAVPGTTAATPTLPTPPRFTVIIDPAHGGTDPGAVLGDGLLEKDIDLAIARRIRNDLNQRGIAVVLLRDGDNALSLDQRAIAANSSSPGIYICIHAATLGSGVRLYTARLSSLISNANRGFLPWDSAQAAFLPASRALEAGLIGQFQSRQIPATPFEAGLRPLRSIAEPAIAIEVAPPANTVEGLTSPIYQQSLASAVGAAIANLRSSLENVR